MAVAGHKEICEPVHRELSDSNLAVPCSIKVHRVPHRCTSANIPYMVAHRLMQCGQSRAESALMMKAPRMALDLIATPLPSKAVDSRRPFNNGRGGLPKCFYSSSLLPALFAPSVLTLP